MGGWEAEAFCARTHQYNRQEHTPVVVSYVITNRVIHMIPNLPIVWGSVTIRNNDHGSALEKYAIDGQESFKNTLNIRRSYQILEYLPLKDTQEERMVEILLCPHSF